MIACILYIHLCLCNYIVIFGFAYVSMQFVIFLIWLKVKIYLCLFLCEAEMTLFKCSICVSTLGWVPEDLVCQRYQSTASLLEVTPFELIEVCPLTSILQIKTQACIHLGV